MAELSRRYQSHNFGLSLPSLRIDSFSIRLMDSLPSRRRTGLTFAPEAGSERLRRMINKNTPEDEILETAAAALDRGWTGLKLYFMLGLPTETIDDVEGFGHRVPLYGRCSVVSSGENGSAWFVTTRLDS